MKFETFENLDGGKKERVMNAALAEFARKGYADASTNNIVAAAKISKGLLFHYFGSKKNLYLYLYHYVCDVMEYAYSRQLNHDPGDLPAALKQLLTVKLEVLKRHPDIADFAARCLREQSPEVRDELDKIIRERQSEYKEKFLFGNLDAGMFRPEFRNGHASRLIRWALEGYIASVEREYREKDSRDIPVDEMIKDFDVYVEIIRKAFYAGPPPSAAPAEHRRE